MEGPGVGEALGPRDAGAPRLRTYLLDSTVVIQHLRRDPQVGRSLAAILGAGGRIATSVVTVSEVLGGVEPRERRRALTFLDRLELLATTREAARRAGDYQATLRRKGVTIQTTDALIAGTARAHGAVLLTHNARDFPMRDLDVESPPT